MTAVRPRARLSTARANRASIAASTAEVASSRMRHTGFATYARARATSCRSPRRGARPARPPASRGRRPASRPTPRGRARRTRAAPRRRRRRPAEADVLRDRRVEEERVLRDHHERRPQRRALDVAQIDSRDEDAALGRVGQAREQLRERGLARSGRAHDRDARAGIDHDRHVAQRGLRDLGRARPGAIRERHVLDCDRGRARWQQDAGVGLDDVDRRVEQVEHAGASPTPRSESRRGSR